MNNNQFKKIEADQATVLQQVESDESGEESDVSEESDGDVPAADTQNEEVTEEVADEASPEPVPEEEAVPVAVTKLES